MQTITSILAASVLREDPNSIIIDVRTAEEWAEGVVKSNSTPPIFLSLYTGSARIFNENFIDDFKALELPKDMTLLFLCKSGGRSAMAAELVSELGYTKCINIIDGFAGWRACNLPIDNESIS
jgi:rhodanese-related sulfurtransferase